MSFVIVILLIGKSRCDMILHLKNNMYHILYTYSLAHKFNGIFFTSILSSDIATAITLCFYVYCISSVRDNFLRGQYVMISIILIFVAFDCARMCETVENTVELLAIVGYMFNLQHFYYLSVDIQYIESYLQSQLV